MNSNGKGAVAEAEIAAAAVRLGFHVARPMPEGQRYDLLIDTGERVLRVQCKWARRVNDVLSIRLSTSRHTPHGYVRTVYSADEIDAIAAYNPDTDKCYLIPIDEIAGRSNIHLRLEPPLNNQAAKLNWAEQYRFGAVAQLGRASGWQPEGRGFESPQLHSAVSEETLLDESVNLTDLDRTKSQIGASLRAERKRRGWSQGAVSRRSGLAGSVLSRLENGIGDPHLSVIERYAASLGYALQYHLIPAGHADQQPSVVLPEQPTTNWLHSG